MQKESTNGPISKRARVLVAIGINPQSQRLLEAGARLAQGLDSELLAVHVQPKSKRASLYQANLNWHLQHAESFGAKMEVITGDDVAAAMVAYAQQKQITHLVLGQSEVSRWHEIRRGSVINRILREIARQSANIDLYIVTISSYT